MKCYFCGHNDLTEKVKFTGKQDGKKRQKTTYVCVTCSAMADEEWFEKELCWDEGSLEIEGVK